MIELKKYKEGYYLYLCKTKGVYLCAQQSTLSDKSVQRFDTEEQARQAILNGGKWGWGTSFWIILCVLPEFISNGPELDCRWVVGDSNEKDQIGMLWDFDLLCPTEKLL